MIETTTIEYVGHAEAVRLATWMPRFHIDPEFHHHGTHWSLDLQLPTDVRIEYRIELDRDGRTESILDPLNPRTATNPFGQNSVLEGSAYMAPAWLGSEPKRSSRLPELRVASQILGGRRSVHLYRPPDAVDATVLPLLFVFDGLDYIRHAAIVQCFDALIDEGRVAPFRAVLSNPRHRHVEYAASEAHAQCILDEVLPYVGARVAISSLGAMGASLGAVAALNLVTAAPERFDGAILMSGTFARSRHPELDSAMLHDIETFVDQVLAAPPPESIAIHQSCGRYESLIDWNREVAEQLEAGRHSYEYVETWTGHDWGAWRDQMQPGLEQLWGR